MTGHRRHHLWSLIALIIILASPATPAAVAAVDDGWRPAAPAAPIGLTALGTDFAPVHGTLLPDGRVMLFGKAGDRVKAAWFVPTPLGQPLPDTVALNVDQVPLDRDQELVPDPFGRLWFVHDTLFCAGHTLTADGSLFVAGGTLLLHETI